VAIDGLNLKEVEKELELQLSNLPRKAIAEKALAKSRIVTVNNDIEALEVANLYAPEHLIVSVKNYADFAQNVVNAGSVFLGNYTPESAGDYASGTNHTLPTNGFARAYSGISLDSFTKKIFFQEIDEKGIQNLGPTIEIMAATEMINGHKNAVTLRLEYLNNR